MSEIVAIIAGLATIVGGLVWVSRRISWTLTKTSDQGAVDLRAQEEKNKEDAESSGRPV